jgi:hypothetical protein
MDTASGKIAHSRLKVLKIASAILAPLCEEKFRRAKACCKGICAEGYALIGVAIGIDWREAKHLRPAA